MATVACCLALGLPAGSPAQDRAAAAPTPTPTPSPAVRVDGAVTTRSDRDGWDYAFGVAQIVGALAAAGGLIFLIVQIRHAREGLRNAAAQLEATRQTADATREDARDRRTLVYAERWGSRELMTLASLTISFLEVDDAADAVDKIRAWTCRAHAEAPCLPRTPRSETAPRARPNDVMQVMSFFEGLGNAYNSDDVNKALVAAGFASQPVQFLTSGWWFVCWRRGGLLASEFDIYAEFEALATTVRAASGKDARPNQRIRVLCIPRECETALLGDWERCGRLAKALSEAGAHDDRRTPASFDELVAAAGDGGREPDARHAAQTGLVERLIAIPPDIGMTVEDWSATRDVAARLHERLQTLTAPELDGLVRRLEARAVTTNGRP